MMSLKMELRKIRYMMLANFRIQMLFSLGLLLQIGAMAIGAASYFFLTKLFQETPMIMGNYQTDIVSYIFIGLALNSMLMQSANGVYNALVSSYQDRSLERISMSPTNIHSYWLSQMFAGYVSSVINAIIYIVIGGTLFGVTIRGTHILPSILILILGVTSTLGYGMLLTQIFFRSSIGKGVPSVIHIFTNLFAQTFSGATFPIEVFQTTSPWLFGISLFLPQTHALRAIRLILAGYNLSNFTLVLDIVYLILFALISIPLGIYLIKKGLDRIRKEGYVPIISTYLL